MAVLSKLILKSLLEGTEDIEGIVEVLNRHAKESVLTRKLLFHANDFVRGNVFDCEKVLVTKGLIVYRKHKVTLRFLILHKCDGLLINHGCARAEGIIRIVSLINDRRRSLLLFHNDYLRLSNRTCGIGPLQLLCFAKNLLRQLHRARLLSEALSHGPHHLILLSEVRVQAELDKFLS